MRRLTRTQLWIRSRPSALRKLPKKKHAQLKLYVPRKLKALWYQLCLCLNFWRAAKIWRGQFLGARSPASSPHHVPPVHWQRPTVVPDALLAGLVPMEDEPAAMVAGWAPALSECSNHGMTRSWRMPRLGGSPLSQAATGSG